MAKINRVFGNIISFVLGILLFWSINKIPYHKYSHRDLEMLRQGHKAGWYDCESAYFRGRAAPSETESSMWEYYKKNVITEQRTLLDK